MNDAEGDRCRCGHHAESAGWKTTVLDMSKPPALNQGPPHPPLCACPADKLAGLIESGQATRPISIPSGLNLIAVVTKHHLFDDLFLE
ncbi:MULTISPECIES: hypothetical protein [Sphingomonas]|jgi:hypothetical protein|uniref:Uncharacterized protein n=1 Tax=Sphingomonas olei TaxID=1886787 RepID=A0ABY2QG40_9SPHN|nr:hypothetical protein [Sphingomonas olei]THG39374.1 hypothetical protein E5988_11855 [Sphingomonas olei]